mmetsp:Transcript_8229/g.16481  ORF Transcript_8229/g.16481 Transcript_8229/m.16481 type:complete len:259 (-) Transcript_8229:456-1232(-)
MPSPVLALTAAARGSIAASTLRFSRCSAVSKSILLKTRTRGLSPQPSSSSTADTAAQCLNHTGLLPSTTSTRTSLARTSSRVALKAATRVVGSFWMKPTVSVRITSGWVLRPGSCTLLVVGSRVAKSMSSASTFDDVSLLSRLLFPAFVYPMSDTRGTPNPVLDLRCRVRCRPMASICLLRDRMRSRMRRLSISSWLSPGPRRPTPPAPLCLSRWLQSRVRRGALYVSMASVTWSFPSRVRACWANMSRISAVRSTTL